MPQYWVVRDKFLEQPGGHVLDDRPEEIARRAGPPGPVLLAMIWTLIGSLAYARHYLQDHGTVPPARMFFEYLTWLTCFWPWAAFAPLVFWAERRFPLGGKRWLRNLAWLAGGALPLAYVATLLTVALNVALQAIFLEPDRLLTPWWYTPFREVGVHLVLYWTTVVAAYVIRSLLQAQDQERQTTRLALEKAQLESTLRSAELETLRARLNPHFLFNCLQNVSVLIREDPGAASQMLARLGVLLRTALRRDGTPETTLSAEVELTRNYVSVEKVRFGGRLTVLFDIAPETALAQVPTFLLQPLVENAIVHGLRGVQHAGIISVRSAIDTDKLVITVTDNGIGLPVEKAKDIEHGVGLAATCQRLEKMYPQQHSFSIGSLPEGGTEVRLSVPLHFASSSGAVADEQTALVGR